MAIDPVSDQDLSGVSSGDKHVYFYGRYCYEDIFFDGHWTDFCAVWKSDGKGGLNAQPDNCPIGNEADRTKP